MNPRSFVVPPFVVPPSGGSASSATFEKSYQTGRLKAGLRAAGLLAARLRTERGVALVITLILLALITTLAIAFLALTHRETGAVDSMARTTDAEEACESALERAKAQIIAPFPFLNAMTNGTEIMGPDLTVSVCHDTNWLKPSGMFFDPSPPIFI